MFIHILAAVMAFGPGFAFPFIGILARKTPGSFPLVAKLGETLGKKLIVPMAVVVLLSGLSMIYVREINLLKTPYLLAALLLMLVAISIAIGVQLPAATALSRLADRPPDPDQKGPSPEAMRLIQKTRITGMILLAFFVVILFLMVFRPGGITTI